MKKAALTAIQVCVTLGILFFVFRDPAKRAEMAAALKGADSVWLFIGIAVYGLAEIVACIRWQTLLRVQGIVINWRRVFSLNMIGLFFSFLIPGDTGGDVVKLFYVLKETAGQRTVAVLSVLVDRLIGLIALVVLAAALTVTHWTWLTGTPQTAQFVWLVFIILGVGIVGLTFSFIVTGFGLVHRLPARMPGRERLAELALAYNLYARAWKPSLAAFILSFGVHLLHMATFYCAALAFSGPKTITPTAGEFFSIAPIINTIVSLPISLGGIGVRESLFEIFLGDLCGVTQAIAVIISSTGYVLTLFWGLVGAAIYLAYRPSEHARLREMRQEVAAAEHTVAELELAREAGHGDEKAQKSKKE